MDVKMKQQKNFKYFVFGDDPEMDFPPFRHETDPARALRVGTLNANTVPGSEFYVECLWLLPGRSILPAGARNNWVDAHKHDWGELIGFFGYNYENIHDLGAEVELWIDGKRYNIKESFAAFIPPGVEHCPLNITNIVKPVFHLTAGPTGKYA
jgi:hypothetical protein